MAVQTKRDNNDARNYLNGRRKDIEVFNSESTKVPLHTVGAGRTLFLVCSGPSLNDIDLSILNQRGIVTMGLNNSPAGMAAQGLRMPNYWVCVDRPGNFIEQIWKDPSTMKIVPMGHLKTKIRTRNPAGDLIDSAFQVRELPNVFFFNRYKGFDPDTYLTSKDFFWGNDDKEKDKLGCVGSRSVMYVAIKMAYYLGFGKLCLVGADFKMELGKQNYAFPQDRTESSVNSNNRTYDVLNTRLAALNPLFIEANFNVVNCTPDSGLTTFPKVDLKEAVTKAIAEVTEKPINTLGHYDPITVK